MTRNTSIVTVIAALTAATGAASGATLAISTFDNGTEGWTAQAGPGTTQVATTWHVSGGAPDGHIQFVDTTMSTSEFFSASSSFLGSGNFSSAVGNGGVSFEWLTDFPQAGQLIQVAFESGFAGGSILWAETAAAPGTSWNHYDFAFDTSVQWWMQNNGNMTMASMSDLNGVLSSVDGMWITADVAYGLDGTSSLDNARIYSVPAPGALALLGMASIVGTRRRRSTRT